MKAQQMYAKLLDEINLHEDEIKRIKQRANDLFTIFGDDLRTDNIPVERTNGHIKHRIMSDATRAKLAEKAKAKWKERKQAKPNGKTNGKGRNFAAGDWTEDENDKIISIVKKKQPVFVRDIALEVAPALKGRTMGGILQHIAKMNELKISRQKQGAGMPKLMAEVAA